MISKEKFIQNYRLENTFLKAAKKGLTWDILTRIYDDYCSRKLYYDKWVNKVIEKLRENAPSEAIIIYGRAKSPEHLLEKIIRKVGKEDKADYLGIDEKTYRTIITDLIGVRILILKKEDWDIVDKHIHKKYKKLAESPVAYVCYGDRDIYDRSRISTQYTNKGYRSQHYLVCVDRTVCEIQVRTLAEEVYGEYDHKVRYPYRLDSTFLARYNRIISKLTADLDDLISTSLTLSDKNIDLLNENFSHDSYRDWSREVDEFMAQQQNENVAEYIVQKEGTINAKTFAANKLLHRKR